MCLLVKGIRSCLRFVSLCQWQRAWERRCTSLPLDEGPDSDSPYVLSLSGFPIIPLAQASECYSLLPGSAAAQEQLAGIAAAQQLHALGLDLPPLRLQQLREQAAGGGGSELDQARASCRYICRSACILTVCTPCLFLFSNLHEERVGYRLDLGWMGKGCLDHSAL